MALNGYITEETAAAEANSPLPQSLSVAVPDTPQAGGYYAPQRKVGGCGRAEWGSGASMQCLHDVDSL